MGRIDFIGIDARQLDQNVSRHIASTSRLSSTFQTSVSSRRAQSASTAMRARSHDMRSIGIQTSRKLGSASRSRDSDSSRLTRCAMRRRTLADSCSRRSDRIPKLEDQTRILCGENEWPREPLRPSGVKLGSVALHMRNSSSASFIASPSSCSAHAHHL
jgi:hypothetical protein